MLTYTISLPLLADGHVRKNMSCQCYIDDMLITGCHSMDNGLCWCFYEGWEQLHHCCFARAFWPYGSLYTLYVFGVAFK